jgi:hypothetical protein
MCVVFICVSMLWGVNCVLEISLFHLFSPVPLSANLDFSPWNDATLTCLNHAVCQLLYRLHKYGRVVSLQEIDKLLALFFTKIISHVYNNIITACINRA